MGGRGYGVWSGWGRVLRGREGEEQQSRLSLPPSWRARDPRHLEEGGCGRWIRESHQKDPTWGPGRLNCSPTPLSPPPEHFPSLTFLKTLGLGFWQRRRWQLRRQSSGCGRDTSWARVHAGPLAGKGRQVGGPGLPRERRGDGRRWFQVNLCPMLCRWQLAHLGVGSWG